VDSFLPWLEGTALSLYVRESESIAFGFPGILVLHTLGMGFLAGISFAIDLRILGFARGVSLSALQKFLPLFAVALVVNVVSGILLLIGYPTKALTNPVFYVKLTLIACGLFLLQRIRREAFAPGLTFEPFPKNLRRIAIASIICWMGAITAGRFLAYTYIFLLYGHATRF
jgi:hypothetical protein